MTTSSRSKLIDNIEHKTGRKAIIDTIETDNVLAKCRSQHQSPLFALLPREIRDLVWAFATAQVEHQNEQYDKTAYYFRPGHTAKLKTEYNILLTCRQAWLEAHALPMLQAEHCFWYYREAPDARSKVWMANLTALNRKHFGTLHLYVQMYAIENLTSRIDGLKGYFLPPSSIGSEDFQPLRFHVTVRHTDWWHWEDEAPLRFEYGWFEAMLNSPDLRRTETLKLELETLDYKIAQLNPIVEHIQRLQSKEFDTHLVDGKPTTTHFVLHGEPEISSWNGPTKIDGKEYSQYKHKKELVYHVVTLTWKLRFPQYPSAHIPNLRLAPQVRPEYPVPGSPGWLDLVDRSDSELDDERGNDMIQSEDAAIPVRRPFRRHLQLRGRWERWHSTHITQPMSNDQAEKMIGWERGNQMKSFFQARLIEWHRRREFGLSMKPRWETYWHTKFAAENSLLRLDNGNER